MVDCFLLRCELINEAHDSYLDVHVQVPEKQMSIVEI